MYNGNAILTAPHLRKRVHEHPPAVDRSNTSNTKKQEPPCSARRRVHQNHTDGRGASCQNSKADKERTGQTPLEFRPAARRSRLAALAPGGPPLRRRHSPSPVPCPPQWPGPTQAEQQKTRPPSVTAAGEGERKRGTQVRGPGHRTLQRAATSGDVQSRSVRSGCIRGRHGVRRAKGHPGSRKQTRQGAAAYHQGGTWTGLPQAAGAGGTRTGRGGSGGWSSRQAPACATTGGRYSQGAPHEAAVLCQGNRAVGLNAAQRGRRHAAPTSAKPECRPAGWRPGGATTARSQPHVGLREGWGWACNGCALFSWRAGGRYSADEEIIPSREDTISNILGT